MCPSTNHIYFSIQNNLNVNDIDEILKANSDVVAYSISGMDSTKDKDTGGSECNDGNELVFYKSIDFDDLSSTNHSGIKSKVVIRLKASADNVKHTLSPIDRCCPLKDVKYDGFDNFKR